jgi:3-oxoacyl-(acyl-carrier-protein) synthase
LTIDYISGAGNSSRGLDVLEARGVKMAFPSEYPRIPVSSVKSMIGEAVASGGMRMVANVLSMEYGFVPPTINYSNSDPECNLPYVVNQKKDREIRALLHLGISPEDCFSSVFMGVEWNP